PDCVGRSIEVGADHRLRLGELAKQLCKDGRMRAILCGKFARLLDPPKTKIAKAAQSDLLTHLDHRGLAHVGPGSKVAQGKVRKPVPLSDQKLRYPLLGRAKPRGRLCEASAKIFT